MRQAERAGGRSDSMDGMVQVRRPMSPYMARSQPRKLPDAVTAIRKAATEIDALATRVVAAFTPSPK